MRQATKDAGRATPAVEQIQQGLSVVAQSVTQVRAHERMLEAAGIRLDRAGASLLYKLHLGGDAALRVTTLAERLGVDTPTVTRKVQQLERLGLVAREADPDDRRAIRIRLTDEGRDLLHRLLIARRQWLDRMLEGWSADDLESFASLLGRFSTQLQEELEGLNVN